MKASSDRPLGVPGPSAAPTPLAMAQLKETGSARYRFYLEGTSACILLSCEIPDEVLVRSHSIALGGLGLVGEPIASTLLQTMSRVPTRTTVLLGPNCRPDVSRGLTRFRTRIQGSWPAST